MKTKLQIVHFISKKLNLAYACLYMSVPLGIERVVEGLTLNANIKRGLWVDGDDSLSFLPLLMV